MKDYNPGNWGLTFIFSLEGSVFPRACACALPNSILAVVFWYFLNDYASSRLQEYASSMTISQVWVTYNWCIGFMVSFRAQRAYGRWWEGGTLLQQARGEWFNAYSSLIAFCTRQEDKVAVTKLFQVTLARLMSLLNASALMSISTDPLSDFEILDVTGFDENHLLYLKTQSDKCEIILQWIQRLIVDNMSCGVLPIPPPILSRVFQELSRGIVNVHNVRKITEFQFPFPFAQMIMSMLIIQWFLTPLFCAILVGSPFWAFLLTFFPIFACWGLNYIAAEIEQPFGRDANDMPMQFMQSSMNCSLVSLLDAEAQSPPEFDVARSQDLRDIDRIVPGRQGSSDDILQLAQSRSVRSVTIQNEESLYRSRHRFTTDNRSDRAKSKIRQSWEFQELGQSISFVPATSCDSGPSGSAQKTKKMSSNSITPMMNEITAISAFEPSSKEQVCQESESIAAAKSIIVVPEPPEPIARMTSLGSEELRNMIR